MPDPHKSLILFAFLNACAAASVAIKLHHMARYYTACPEKPELAMLGLNVARIPFNVRMTEGIFRGEVIGIGDELKDGCIFEVRMTDGDVFYLKAEPDYELRRFNWTSIACDKVKRLIPMIGRLIERYFSGNKS